MILVVGATAFFGRQAVETLAARHIPVRALTRDPSSAALPGGVEVVQADLTDPASLPAAVDGVTAVLLVLPFGFDPAPLLALVPGRRIVVLSSSAVEENADAIATYYRRLETAVAATTGDWTALRILFPAINSLAFAQQLTQGDVIRMPYPDASTAAVHERDVAEAAVAVLTQDGHRGKVYDLTGPAALTQEEQVAAIGSALGRELRVEGLDPAAVLEQLAQFLDRGFAGALLGRLERATKDPAPITSTVEDLTGHPARPYAEWLRDRIDAFR